MKLKDLLKVTTEIITLHVNYDDSDYEEISITPLNSRDFIDSEDIIDEISVIDDKLYVEITIHMGE